MLRERKIQFSSDNKQLAQKEPSETAVANIGLIQYFSY